MITKKTFTYQNAMLFGLITELVLVVSQLLYMSVFVKQNPGVEFAFTTEYMKSQGFYIFQIIGFFVYTTSVYFLFKAYQINSLGKVLVYIITGGVVELSFYLIIQATYEGAFLYSILDKFVAAVFGTIFYYYTTGKPNK
ncbi:MAG: hypothetical protein ABJH04_10295 [Cyclobacteriaceae bacterium]